MEHPEDGLGFWRSCYDDTGFNRRSTYHSNYDEISQRHADYEKFPGYYSDRLLMNKIGMAGKSIHHYNFAFLSLEQFNEAFTPEETKECIIDLGFRVLMYDVSKDYFTSQFQVVFIKSSADSVEDVSSLFL